MERLSDTAIDIINDLHTERLDYNSEYLPLIDAVNKLQEYEDAEEKGLLVHLPCKVGDTVYELSEGFVEECTVETIFISNYIDNNGVVSYMAELHYEREDCP